MITKKSFLACSDRYAFDNNLKGFAQIDTEQDASYFGTWANPATLEVISFTEGDVCSKQAETSEEFVNEIREIQKWNKKMGYRKIGIDTGWTDKLDQPFKNLGLGDLLH